MRDRAWCGEHDRSAEFVTTDQERVCFSGLGNAETTCRIETENDAGECEDCVGWQREYAMVLSSRDHWRKLTEEREARLAQIAELLVPPYSKIDLSEALSLAKGEPA